MAMIGGRWERSRGRLTFAPLALAGALCFPSVARADASDEAAAEGLFQEARVLVKAGRYAEACPKLEASQRLDPSTGTMLHLADCYERTGRTASAWALYLSAAKTAKRAGKEDHEQTARKRAAEIEPRLAKLTISVPAESRVEGLSIKRNGAVVDSGAWDSPVPLDPGEQLIEVSAPKKSAWSTRVSVGPEPAARATITIPKLQDEPAPAGLVPPEPAAAGAPGAESATVPARSGAALAAKDTGAAAPDEGGGPPVSALVAGGIGVVGLAVGTIFALNAGSTWDDAQSHCSGDVCDGEARGLSQDAASQGNLATVGFGVGLAGLAAGAILWLSAGPAEPSAAARRAAPSGALRVTTGPAGTGFRGLGFTGRF